MYIVISNTFVCWWETGQKNLNNLICFTQKLNRQLKIIYKIHMLSPLYHCPSSRYLYGEASFYCVHTSFRLNKLKKKFNFIWTFQSASHWNRLQIECNNLKLNQIRGGGGAMLTNFEWFINFLGINKNSILMIFWEVIT